jgi:hypothetical protein
MRLYKSVHTVIFPTMFKTEIKSLLLPVSSKYLVVGSKNINDTIECPECRKNETKIEHYDLLTNAKGLIVYNSVFEYDDNYSVCIIINPNGNFGRVRTFLETEKLFIYDNDSLYFPHIINHKNIKFLCIASESKNLQAIINIAIMNCKKLEGIVLISSIDIKNKINSSILINHIQMNINELQFEDYLESNYGYCFPHI